MSRHWAASLRHAVIALLLMYGGIRFLNAAWLPASRALTGDFGGSFPTSLFARLRPDFPTGPVLPGWNYGPMLHFLTLPLLMVPAWSSVPMVWASMNLMAVAVSFALACRLSGVTSEVSWGAVASVAALWLLFQPLATCFAQGNIEMIELATTLAALSLLHRAKGRISGVLLGVASTIKFLPIGFLAWLLMRREWRAVAAGAATIASVAVITIFTLGWKESISFSAMGWAVGAPVAGLHELSVTSLFLHHAGVFDYDKLTVRWFPSARADAAARAGALASVLLAAGVALLLSCAAGDRCRSSKSPCSS